MIYTAARIAGLSSSNYFMNIDQNLVITADDDDTDNTASALLPRCEFPKMCEEMWTRLRSTPGFFNEDISDTPFHDNLYVDRSHESYLIGRQLAEWRREYEAVMEEFIKAEYLYSQTFASVPPQESNEAIYVRKSDFGTADKHVIITAMPSLLEALHHRRYTWFPCIEAMYVQKLIEAQQVSV